MIPSPASADSWTPPFRLPLYQTIARGVPAVFGPGDSAPAEFDSRRRAVLVKALPVFPQQVLLRAESFFLCWRRVNRLTLARPSDPGVFELAGKLAKKC